MKTFRLIGITIIIILTSVTFTACKDGNSNEPVNPTPNETPTITIDSSIITNGLVFAAEGNEKSITFTTNTNWTLNIAPTTSGSTWCTASATNGNKGEATVRFTTTKNDDYDDRSIAVTIKAGTASKTFTITQKCKEAILLTAKKFEVNQIGGSIDVEVNSNIDYQMEISETAKSWITQTNTRALSTHNYTFNIATNEEHDKREGEIFFKKGDYEEIVTVYQSGGALVMLTKDEYTVSDKGEAITVEIKSNIEYGVKMPQVDWIYDEASTRGASSHTLKYIISPNESYDSRSAQIVYYDKNDETNADTLTITQMQKDAIVIAKNEYIIGAKEGTIEVELSSNIDYTISIADDGKNWISRTENTRAMTADKVNFKIAENTFDNSRTSYITFTSDNGVSQKIKIFQQGAGSIYVATAGTLSKLIDSSIKDNITKLRITGNLNSADIKFIRNMKSIQILDLYGVNMTSIGKRAFCECSSITSIIIPNSVTSIGEEAFSKCSNLTSITIGDNVISIEANAFFLCRKLTSVSIGNGVTKIPEHAFEHCSDLTSVTLGNNVTAIEEAAFYFCSSLTSITIPNSVKRIGYKAFYNCSNLSSIIIGNSVTSIEDYAYSECSSLTSISIPNSVTNIGICAFDGCSNLEFVSIGNGVNRIGVYAFFNCESLTSFNVDNGNSNFSSTDGVLYNKDKTKLIQCPRSKTSITISDSVASIGKSAFSSCTNLTSVTFPNNVKEIGEYSFYNCLSLTSIEIPNSVTYIARSTFSNCSSLNSVTIPNSVTSIDEHAFLDCSSLISINIPNSVTDIYESAFSGCLSLTSITIPCSVHIKKNDVFKSCPNIREIHIKDGYSWSFNTNIFNDVNKEMCILYVQKGYKDIYSAESRWSDFKDIIEE